LGTFEGASCDIISNENRQKRSTARIIFFIFQCT
jgi:hypothetical protein